MLAKARRLAPGDWVALALALPLLAGSRLLIVAVPYRWWRRAISTDTHGRAAPVARLGPGRVRWAVTVAARFIPGATCLSQALAARALLRLAGHPTTLSIGVRKGAAGELEAHAWVHSGAAPVVGVQAEGTYEVLRRGEPAAR
jgi:Transglutaminase-like superfamily